MLVIRSGSCWMLRSESNWENNFFLELLCVILKQETLTVDSKSTVVKYHNDAFTGTKEAQRQKVHSNVTGLSTYFWVQLVECPQGVFVCIFFSQQVNGDVACCETVFWFECFHLCKFVFKTMFWGRNLTLVKNEQVYRVCSAESHLD